MLHHESAELAAVELSYDRQGFPPSPLCLDRVSDDVPRRGSADVSFRGPASFFVLFTPGSRDVIASCLHTVRC